MKYLVILFALISLAASSTVHEESNKIEDECKVEFGVTDDEMKDVRGNKPDSQNVKSMRACIMKKEGMMNAEGGINKDKTKTVLMQLLKDKATEDVVSCMVDECGGEEPNNDHAEAASRHAECIRSELKENSFTPVII